MFKRIRDWFKQFRKVEFTPDNVTLTIIVAITEEDGEAVLNVSYLPEKPPEMLAFYLEEAIDTILNPPSHLRVIK